MIIRLYKDRFLVTREFVFLWIKNSFSGLPSLELVILWSKSKVLNWIRKCVFRFSIQNQGQSWIRKCVFRSSVQTHKGPELNSQVCIPVFSSNPRLVWERYCLCTVQVWLIQTGRHCPTAIVKRPMSCAVL